MTWKVTKKTQGWEPLPGIPFRDMTDDEFKARVKDYAEVNGMTVNAATKAVQESGFFEHREDVEGRVLEKES